MKFLIALTSLFIFLGCQPTTEKFKQYIIEIEKAFAANAKENGVAEAFLAYAADDARRGLCSMDDAHDARDVDDARAWRGNSPVLARRALGPRE